MPTFDADRVTTTVTSQVSSVTGKVSDLGSFLREQRQHARLSLRQLAEQAGVSNPYLSQVERGLRKPSAEVLQGLAKGLRISAEALYVRAGILDERGDQAEVRSAVLGDGRLTERQKRVLLDIYESFRAENARDATAAETPVETVSTADVPSGADAPAVADAVPAQAAEPEESPDGGPAPRRRSAAKRAAKAASPSPRQKASGTSATPS